MLAQIVNFAIVVFVLWFFALKPLAKKMAERTKKIENSLEEAKKISENFKISKAQTDAMIIAARKDAMKIIENAKTSAERERGLNLQKARAEVEKVVLEGKSQIGREKEKMMQEVRGDVAMLVVAATAKILEKVNDKAMDKKIIEKMLDEI